MDLPIDDLYTDDDTLCLAASAGVKARLLIEAVDDWEHTKNVVYMKFDSVHDVTFADNIKWVNQPTIKAGTIIKYTFTHIYANNTAQWLGEAVVYE